jgi:general secretion pathway protein D
MDAPGETVIEVITLKYISPAAVIDAVKDMLSLKGKIKIIESSSERRATAGEPLATRIAVIDLPEVTDKITSFIAQLDKPEPQIAIEVRMIEVNVDGETRTGFKWPTSITARGHGIEMTSDNGLAGTDEAVGQIDLPDGKWQWGTLSVGELELVLDFLESKGNSKLISDPRITTLNNHEAEIKVTTIVPIQTINRFSEGGAVQDIVTFQDEEIGITLKVTPHIAEGDDIILDVYPTVAEIIGYSGPVDNQKPITSERSVRTKINVRDGQTAVLGGMIKENKIDREQSVFFLGSLPIIGNLFKHKTVQTSSTDLLILITPQIMVD